MNNDPSINIQVLEKEYNSILKQYEEAYNNYITDLQSSDISNLTVNSNYQLLNNNGITENTVCSTATNTSPLWVGNYSSAECAGICDKDTDCSGYQLADKDSNDNYNCGIYKKVSVSSSTASPGTNGVQTAGYGCFAKKSSSYYTPSPANPANFVSLKGRTYWGTAALSQGTARTKEACETMCASDANCTGATFNPVKKYCWTRKGDGNITVGTSNDYALIPKVRQNLAILKGLNARLLEINSNISKELQKLYPIAQEDIAAKNAKQLELNQYYSSLVDEQALIEQRVQEYETLEAEYTNKELFANQHNSTLKLWTLLAIILLALTLQSMLKIQFASLGFILLFVAILIVFSFNYK